MTVDGAGLEAASRRLDNRAMLGASGRVEIRITMPRRLHSIVKVLSDCWTHHMDEAIVKLLEESVPAHMDEVRDALGLE